MITVTDSAKKQAIRLMEDDGKEGFFIRVGVEGGGCSGLMYQLTFDNERKEDDSSFMDNDIEVVVDKKYLDDEYVKLYEKEEAQLLPPWDPMGALAR